MVPSRTSKPLGEITLLVQFGTASNYRVEHINFYIADFNTTYHAILSLLALAKCMAVPHYAYLVLKMPSSVGVLDLRANLSIVYACETESLALTEATDLSIQMASVVTDAKTAPADDLEIPALEPPCASTRKPRRSALASTTPPRPSRLGLTSTPNRKARSSPSYVPTPMCLLGNLQTC